jgi:hypothetical protein
MIGGLIPGKSKGVAFHSHVLPYFLFALCAVYFRRALSTSDFLAARYLLETLAHTPSFTCCLSTIHATFAPV